MDRKTRPWRRGFTLIEVMVAMVIMSIGLLAVLKMAYIYVQSNTQNLQRGTASVRTQDKMEQLRSYAVSDRVDKFSVFDFDYLVSEDASFTTVYDPATASDIAVPGLLSGSAGAGALPSPAPSWYKYEVLNDEGNDGDDTAGDGTFSNSDVQTDASTGLTVTRLYTVTPFPAGAARPSFATIEVTTSWTDKSGAAHEVHHLSVVNRRQ